MNPNLKKLTDFEIKEEYDLCKKHKKYFYNNYCRAEGMPEYSQKVFDNYVKDVQEKRNTYKKRAENISDLKKFYENNPLSIDELINTA